MFAILRAGLIAAPVALSAGAIYGVNVGCLEGIAEEELSKIPITYVDGMNDRFEAPEFFAHL